MAVSGRHGVARRLLKISFIAVSLGLAVHLILLSLPGIHQSVLVMRHLNPALLLVAVSLEAGSLIALAQLYRVSVASFDHDIGFSQALRLSMAMFTLTRILPAGGAAAAVFGAAQLTDLDVKPASAATSVVVAGALGMTTLAAIVGVGAAASLLKGDLPAAYLAPVLLLLGIVLGIGYLAHRIASNVSFTRAVIRKLEKVLRRLRMKPDLTEIYEVVEELSRRMPSSRELRPLFGWSALNWLLDVAVLWLVFAALGQRLPIAVLLVGYGVANLAMALPITPGGLGLVEAGMSSTFTAFGLPAATAVVGVLGYRLISFWLPLLAGVPQYLAATRRLHAPETSASPG
ncbi:MAG: lysylphosphatidylglycerol synthase transmembrane domain-containing protein [Actinomycetota bacterium]